MVETLMNINQAAKYLRIARQTMYRLIERGKVPCIKFGTGNQKAGTIRFSQALLDKWIGSQCEENASQAR